jgi:hypothetical protein
VRRSRYLPVEQTARYPNLRCPVYVYTHLDTAARVLELMMEGVSVRGISRLTGLHIGTILSLMVTAGEKCQRLLDAKIRNVRPTLVQADELHTFIGCHEKRLRSDAPKEARGHGSRWTAKAN